MKVTYDYMREFVLSLGVNHNTVTKLWYTKIQELDRVTYDAIEAHSAHLANTTTLEKIYLYLSYKTERPKCKMCDNSVTFKREYYHTYCGRNCSMRDMSSNLGGKNASQLDSVKQKKAEKSLITLGVDNVSKSPGVKSTIAKKAKSRWKNTLDDLVEDLKIDTVLNNNTMSRKEYMKTVYRITEHMYNAHIDVIDPERKRGNDWHLDHKISRAYGYQNGIPPYMIGDINNLELLCQSDNLSKSFASSLTYQELVDRYNAYYPNERPFIVNGEFDMKYTTSMGSKKLGTYKAPFQLQENTSGLCKYCGLENSVYLNKKINTWCCSASPNSCPVNKRKNSENQKNSDKKKLATQKRVASFKEKKESKIT